MEQEMEILQGAISAVVYQNYDNGYSVLRLSVGDGQTVTVVGTIPLPAVGERLMVTGRWATHASYGRQFEAEFLERLLPQTKMEILSYLSSRAVKGIGPIFAARIVEHFGEETLLIMEREPLRLSEIPGISRAKAKAIGEEFKLQVGIRQIMEFFAMHQLPAELAVRTYKLYGDRTVELLYDDPYLLMDDGLESPFGAVDRFAIALGVAGDDRRRVEAGILFELKYNLTAGHTFLPEDKLCAATAQLLSVEPEAVREGVSRLLEADRLVRATLAGITIDYLPALYEAETYCALRLLQFAAAELPCPGNMDALMARVSRESGIRYSPQQEQAIREAATRGILLVTGGPGTGKTTIVNSILELLGQMGLSCLLAAPTGRAAKRLGETCGREAATIHRLLETQMDPYTGQLAFTRNQDEPLSVDAVIVDETSMVDISLMAALLAALRGDCRLVLVGDPDQLPSVGPGNVLDHLIRSGAVPAVSLTEIFRQARESAIVMNAHSVNQGVVPQLTNKSKDFFYMGRRDPGRTAETIVELCRSRLPNNMGIPADQIQVLSPTRRRGAGTAALNRALQEALNPAAPDKGERAFGQYIFRRGDRVMQIRNNYDLIWENPQTGQRDLGVFNGDIGVITEVTAGGITVSFDGRVVNYPPELLGELEPAWAVTVHKAQGSEYRAVILALSDVPPTLLARGVLYTAITRARELFIVVGSDELLAQMTANDKQTRRYSALRTRLLLELGEAPLSAPPAAPTGTPL